MSRVIFTGAVAAFIRMCTLRVNLTVCEHFLKMSEKSRLPTRVVNKASLPLASNRSPQIYGGYASHRRIGSVLSTLPRTTSTSLFGGDTEIGGALRFLLEKPSWPFEYVFMHYAPLHTLGGDYVATIPPPRRGGLMVLKNKGRVKRTRVRRNQN